MCQMSVLLEQDGNESIVMENVTRLEVLDSAIKISTLFEEPVEITNASVLSMDFNDGKILLSRKKNYWSDY